MSALYSIRRAVREALISGDLWTRDEVLIKRRTNIWNDVAVATSASANGQCLVIGVAKGKPAPTQKKGSKMLVMEVTIPITLMELPTTDPEEPEDDAETDEDSRWEQTVMLLQANPLGRSALHYELDFDSFEDVLDDEYVIRQTVFTTRLILKPA